MAYFKKTLSAQFFILFYTIFVSVFFSYGRQNQNLSARSIANTQTTNHKSFIKALSSSAYHQKITIIAQSDRQDPADILTEAEAVCLSEECIGARRVSPQFMSQAVCESLIQSDVCKNVPKEKLKQCDKIDGRISVKDAGIGMKDSIWGCLKYSAGEALKAIWEAMEWVGANLTQKEAREKTGEAKDKALASVKLYLNTEYQKAHSKSSPPGRKMKAVVKVSGVISQLMFNMIADAISTDIKEWKCLNTQGKAGKVCEYLLWAVGSGYTIKQILNMAVRFKLKRRLKSPDPEVRIRAVQAVGLNWKGKGGAKALLQIVDDPDPRVVTEIARSVGRLSDNKTRNRIITRLADHPDSKVRLTAVRLALKDGGDIPDDMLFNFAKDPDSKVVMEVIRSVESLNKSKTRSKLVIKLLDHPDPKVRLTAVQSILKSDNDIPGDVLIKFAGDSDSLVAIEAARSVGRLSDNKTRNRIITELLDHPDSKVRLTAVQSARSFMDNNSIGLKKSTLLKWAGDPDISVAEKLADNLGNVPSHQRRFVLREFAKRPEVSLRIAAVRSIRSYKDNLYDFADLLVHYYAKDKFPDVRIELIDSMGENRFLKLDSSLHSLHKNILGVLIKDKDPLVRKHLAQSLKQKRFVDYYPKKDHPLYKLLNDSDSAVRKEAEKVLEFYQSQGK